MEQAKDSASGLYAFVRYTDDGVQRTVPISNIKKFDAHNFDRKKTYKVKFDNDIYYKAHVICVADTIDEIERLTSEKRIRIPAYRLNDDTDMTDGDELLPSAASKTSTSGCKKKNNSAEINNFNNLLLSSQNVVPPAPFNNNNKIEELEKEITQLKKLNFQLQETVINKFEEISVLFQDHQDQQKDSDINPVVGFRKNENVHIGRNIWLPSAIYDTACSKKKDSVFIKEIAVAIFGEVTLLQSSVTGSSSNRTKGPPKPALDGTKLMAIHDIVRHRMMQRGESPEHINSVCKSIAQKIGEKIHDLSRPYKPKKGTKIQAEAGAAEGNNLEVTNNNVNEEHNMINDDKEGEKSD